MRRFLIPLLATALAAAAYGQRLDPADYVYPVLDVSRLYAANFGELRPAHFHAGIDIKTDGVEGKPLVAVADGYVSRVSLAAGGYGRAIYLTLDNGTTAVYGHLQRFRDDIEKRVREERYRNRTARTSGSTPRSGPSGRATRSDFRATAARRWARTSTSNCATRRRNGSATSCAKG